MPCRELASEKGAGMGCQRNGSCRYEAQLPDAPQVPADKRAAAQPGPPVGCEARGASSSPDVNVLGLSSRLLLVSRPRQR